MYRTPNQDRVLSDFAEYRHPWSDTKDSLAHRVFGKVPGKLRIDFLRPRSSAMIQARLVRPRSIFMPVRYVQIETISREIIPSIMDRVGNAFENPAVQRVLDFRQTKHSLARSIDPSRERNVFKMVYIN